MTCRAVEPADRVRFGACLYKIKDYSIGFDLTLLYRVRHRVIEARPAHIGVCSALRKLRPYRRGPRGLYRQSELRRNLAQAAPTYVAGIIVAVEPRKRVWRPFGGGDFASLAKLVS